VAIVEIYFENLILTKTKTDVNPFSLETTHIYLGEQGVLIPSQREFFIFKKDSYSPTTCLSKDDDTSEWFETNFKFCEDVTSDLKILFMI
jgi:hypothetical protein